jgi:hypothetical protein
MKTVRAVTRFNAATRSSGVVAKHEPGLRRAMSLRTRNFHDRTSLLPGPPGSKKLRLSCEIVLYAFIPYGTAMP